MNQQTKNRLKAVYIIYVLAILFYWVYDFYYWDEFPEQLGLVLVLVAPIPIYYAVYFWNKTPK